MKREISAVFLFINIINLYAVGIEERDRLPYMQIQLRVINMTDDSINFYFNKLFDPFLIRSTEELITMRAPVNNDYPGYFAVEYPNGHLELCRFEDPVTEVRIFRDLSFSVIINEDEIKIIQGITDEEIATKPNEQWYWLYRRSYNSKEILLEGDYDIIFINSTNNRVNLYIGDPFNNLRSNQNRLDAYSGFHYKINKVIFQLHKRIEVVYSVYFGYGSPVYTLDLFYYITTYGFNRIEVYINDTGYEIKYINDS
jgi:hypothetical protein